MPLNRALLPFFLAFALLFAQQGAAAHALGHAFEQTRQQDQHSSHSTACEQCAAYAQLDSTHNVGAYDFALPAAACAPLHHLSLSRHFAQIFAVAARGPPLHLLKFA